MRIGHGYDVHAFAANRKLVLGGVHIPSELGLAGHSDADVLTHALMDALLSAARLPDIGQLFPDTAKEFEDIDSCKLLSAVAAKLKEKNFTIVDCDLTIAAEEPKLAPYKEAMRCRLAEVLNLSVEQIGLKATTTEGLGFVGRKEGICAWATVLLDMHN